tara:strand:- start:11627 stop:11854 length:228 start_codon:yes stop_codon:yes gene_type:complete
MLRQMYDKDGNSHLVPNTQVQDKLKSGWVFFQKPVSPPKVEENKSIIKTKTKRPKATMRITKAEAEVIKPNEENN